MKTETLTKIAIASLLGLPASCAVERGVIIDRQEMPEENALYVNLIDAKHEQDRAKNTFEFESGEYMADRKLFFMDSAYMEPFIYSLPGDTVFFRNPRHETFLEMNAKNRVRKINNVPERKIIKIVRSAKQRQK